RERAHTLLDLGRARACAGHHADALAAFDAAQRIGDAAQSVVAQARAEGTALGLLDPARREALLEHESGDWSDGGLSPEARRLLLGTGCLREAIAGDSHETALELARGALAGDALLSGTGGGNVLVGVSLALHACD